MFSPDRNSIEFCVPAPASRVYCTSNCLRAVLEYRLRAYRRDQREESSGASLELISDPHPLQPLLIPSRIPGNGKLSRTASASQTQGLLSRRESAPQRDG